MFECFNLLNSWFKFKVVWFKLRSYEFAGTFTLLAWYARIAQLVEQRTENPRVGGSNPPPGTTFSLFILSENLW